MTDRSPSAMFVYGTLKRGFLRESIWPKAPANIMPAAIQANLYDLGPYPAIGVGESWVLGELWQFDPAEMPEVLCVLDEAEGCNQLNEPEYYSRQLVQASTEDGRIEDAFAYFLSDARDVSCLRRIRPSHLWKDKPCAVWPDAESRVPKNLSEEQAAHVHSC